MARYLCALLGTALAAAGPAAAPTPRRAPSPTGTYTLQGMRGEPHTIGVLTLADGRIRVGFDGTVEYETGGGARGANFGRLFGTATLEGNEASFTPYDTETCRIHLRFLKETLVVRQEGGSAECGLGHRVEADGTYTRTSRKAPRFQGFEGEDPFEGKR